MSYQDTIQYLYGLQQHGMKFGLDNIRALLSAAGSPQNSFRSVHIAGTNGKGSTSAMIESVLRTGGVTTGLFTSPHLISFTERIRVNGREITEGDVISLADEVRALAAGIRDLCPTFFEVVTAMAFLHFKRMGVEWAVVETGLGGRLDATNTITPEVTVITRIGLDHREFLGDTIAEVAVEKAGIIKERVPLVTAMQEPEALDVLRRRAVERHADISIHTKDFSSDIIADEPDGLTVDYRGSCEIRNIRVPLAGAHQAVNAALAARASELISARSRLTVDIAGGIAGVKWPGRLELVKNDPPVLIDGAHNPQAASSLAEHLQKLLARRYRRLILVVGVMKDKDISGILSPLLPLAADVICTAPAYGRAASAEQLAAMIKALGYYARPAPTVAGAISLAEGLCRQGDLIVITGSFYTIGEAKEALGTPGVLMRLQESP